MGRGGLALAEREQGAVAVAEDQQVLVVVDALGEAEVLGIEGGGALAVGDGEGDVVERHVRQRSPVSSETSRDSGRWRSLATCRSLSRRAGWASRRLRSTPSAITTSTSVPAPATA